MGVPCTLAASSPKGSLSLLAFPPQGFLGSPGPLLSPSIDTDQRCKVLNVPWSNTQPLGEWELVDKSLSLLPFGQITLHRLRGFLLLLVTATSSFPVFLLPHSYFQRNHLHPILVSVSSFRKHSLRHAGSLLCNSEVPLHSFSSLNPKFHLLCCSQVTSREMPPPVVFSPCQADKLADLDHRPTQP